MHHPDQDTTNLLIRMVLSTVRLHFCLKLRNFQFRRLRSSHELVKMRLFSSGETTPLPKLPVPPIQQTLTLFLRNAEPVVSAQQFQEAKLLVQEFGKPDGEGEELQKFLEKRAQTEKNWLAHWWLHFAYLELRSPLPIVLTPAVSFPPAHFSGRHAQLDFAARLCVALLHFKALIDEKRLPVDMAGSSPMDMSQYDLIFGTCRIPDTPKDRIETGADSPGVRHIVVARNGHFFAMNVLEECGRAPSGGDLLSQLRHIVEQSEEKAPHPVGLLTCLDRDRWAIARRRLQENAGNRRSLDRVEKGLFVLCLDESVAVAESRPDQVLHQVLHGGGSTRDSANRWFDKTLLFCVGRDGVCGLAFEHTPLDGPPIATLMDFVTDHYEKNILSQQISSHSITVEKLDFLLDDSLVSDVGLAAKSLDDTIDNFELKMHVFKKFGKNLPKYHKISPDSFCQLALQLTHFKLHGFHPPTYETGSLRTFLEARTDTIRLPNIESVQFVSDILAPERSAEERAASLRAAVASHKNYTAAVCSGNGMDRHLLGLRLAAKALGRSEPALFSHSVFQQLMHFNLSTSQVPTKRQILMAFSPMYEDCYGICYNPHDNHINFSVTAWKSCPTTSAEKFIVYLEESLDLMHQTLNDSAKMSKL